MFLPIVQIKETIIKETITLVDNKILVVIKIFLKSFVLNVKKVGIMPQNVQIYFKIKIILIKIKVK